MNQTTTEVNEHTHPVDLSASSAALLVELAGQCQTTGRRAMLVQFLRSLDRAEYCRRELLKTGMTTVTERTGAIHLSPLAKLEIESRQASVIAGQLQLLSLAGPLDFMLRGGE